MTRFEFVNKLNGKLYLLSESERRDIIDEYVGHIALKMQEGKTEAEAIRDFGDIDELAREILDAYHIDSTKIQNKTLDIYIKQMVDYISRATEKLLSFSTKNLAYIIVEFALLLIVLNFIRYPIEFLRSMFVHLFSWLPYTIYHILEGLMMLCANLLSVGISLLILFQFVNQRILNTQPGLIDNIQEHTRPAEKPADTPETQENVAAREPMPETKKKRKKFHLPEFKIPQRKAGAKTVKQSAEKAGDFVVNLIVLMLKVMLGLFVWVPSVALTVVAVVCTILAAIVYIFSGIGFIGVLIAGIGCCVLGAGFTLWVTGLLTGGKADA